MLFSKRMTRNFLYMFHFKRIEPHFLPLFRFIEVFLFEPNKFCWICFPSERSFRATCWWVAKRPLLSCASTGTGGHSSHACLSLTRSLLPRDCHSIVKQTSTQNTTGSATPGKGKRCVPTNYLRWTTNLSGTVKDTNGCRTVNIWDVLQIMYVIDVKIIKILLVYHTNNTR